MKLFDVIGFDADDTLWENTALFESIIADFIDWVAHPRLDAAGIRRVLHDIERLNVAAHGYGTKVFTRSLHDAVEHLRGVAGVRVLGGRKEVGGDSPAVAGNRWTYLVTPWGLHLELVDRSRVRDAPALVGPSDWTIPPERTPLA